MTNFSQPPQPSQDPSISDPMMTPQMGMDPMMQLIDPTQMGLMQEEQAMMFLLGGLFSEDNIDRWSVLKENNPWIGNPQVLSQQAITNFQLKVAGRVSLGLPPLDPNKLLSSYKTINKILGLLQDREYLEIPEEVEMIRSYLRYNGDYIMVTPSFDDGIIVRQILGEVNFLFAIKDLVNGEIKVRNKGKQADDQYKLLLPATRDKWIDPNTNLNNFPGKFPERIDSLIYALNQKDMDTSQKLMADIYVKFGNALVLALQGVQALEQGFVFTVNEAKNLETARLITKWAPDLEGMDPKSRVKALVDKVMSKYTMLAQSGVFKRNPASIMPIPTNNEVGNKTDSLEIYSDDAHFVNALISVGVPKSKLYLYSFLSNQLNVSKKLYLNFEDTKLGSAGEELFEISYPDIETTLNKWFEDSGMLAPEVELVRKKIQDIHSLGEISRILNTTFVTDKKTSKENIKETILDSVKEILKTKLPFEFKTSSSILLMIKELMEDFDEDPRKTRNLIREIKKVIQLAYLDSIVSHDQIEAANVIAALSFIVGGSNNETLIDATYLTGEHLVADNNELIRSAWKMVRSGNGVVDKIGSGYWFKDNQGRKLLRLKLENNKNLTRWSVHIGRDWLIDRAYSFYFKKNQVKVPRNIQEEKPV